MIFPSVKEGFRFMIGLGVAKLCWRSSGHPYHRTSDLLLPKQ